MKPRIAIISGLLVAGAVVFCLRQQPQRDATQPAPRAAATSQPTVSQPSVASRAPGVAVASPVAVPVQETSTSRPTVGADRGGPLETVARFKAWSEKYAAAKSDERAALYAEGGALALERREVMREMIQKNPKYAIEQAVPYRVRKTLPPEIVALLEEWVTGRADYKVYATTPAPGQKPVSSVFRQADINGRTYDAFVYGQRVRERSGRNVPIYGVALDNTLAVAESAIRPLDAVEAKDLIAAGKAPVDAICSVSGVKTTVVDAAPAAAAAVQAPATTVVAGAAQASQALETTYGDIGGQVLAFCRPSHVARYGKLIFDRAGGSLNNVLAGGTVSGTSGGGSVPGYTYTQGQKKILYMRLVFPDDQTVPNTEDQAYQDLNDLNNFFVKASHGTFSIQGVVTPLLMMPQTKLWYSIPAPPPGASPATPAKVLGDLYNHARTAAAEAGYYFADYEWDCIRFTTIPGAAWGGLGSVGGPGVWLQSDGLGVIGHEFGHNLGLMHANFWDTTPGAAPGGTQEPSSAAGHNTGNGTGSSIDYGDFFCMMGIGFPGQYNQFHKWNLGWIADSAVTMFNGTTNASSTIRLYAMDAPLVLQNRQHAIRIRRSADREYWFQYRTEISANDYLQNGLQVLWSGNGVTGAQNGDSDLLDMTPNSTLAKTDSPLPIGQTFHDPQINLFITPLNRTGSGSNAFMDVVVNIGHFPTNVAPTNVSLTADSVAIAPGGSVTFTAAFIDPNNDQLAYHWDFADLSVSTNAAVISHTFTNAGEYVVRCVATDMKGGTASKSIVVTVGNPGTFRISGIVRFEQGFIPVAGVRVDNGLTGANYGYSYTDSDGSFTLVNLPNGTYNIGAWKYGFHFEPFSGTHPESIILANVNDTATIWNASQLPVVTISNITSVTEGSLSTVVLNRSGSTNAGLDVVLITPFNDTFQFNSATVTTDFTQTNGILVAQSNANTTNIILLQVTFPAGISNLTLTFSNVADGVYEGPEHFFVDLADPFFFPNSFFQNPVFVTNYPMIPGWRVNANPQTYAYLPTTTVIRTDPPYVIGRPTTHTPSVLIRELDAPTLPTISVFAVGNVALESGFDPGEFAFTSSVVLTNDLTVFYTMSGTASNGQDYVFMPGSFVLSAQNRLAFLSLVATNDYFVEGQETATLTITPNANYAIATASANMTIVDDDLPSVSVISLDTTATETGGNPATFTFTRTGNLDRALTVNYVVSGTASSGTDFNTLPGSITIPLGQTRATVTLTAIDDALNEGDETVIVTVVDSVFYNTGSPNFAQASIQDDERNTVTVAGTASAAEGGSGSFTLTRTGDTTASLTVFFTVGGSAVGGVGADYNSIGTVAVIPPGAATLVIPVTTIDDNFFEPTETVILTLSSNSTYNIGSASPQASINITDNDSTSNPSIGFMLGSSSNPEYSNSVTLAVYLSALPPMGDLTTNGSTSRIKVDYGVSGGNAVNGTDFNLASGTLIWRNGTNFAGQDPTITDELIQNITFTVNNDLLINGDRTFVVTLTNRIEAITYDGPSHNYLARVGTANNPLLEDRTFAIGFGPNDVVRGIYVQSDSNVVAVGDFTAISVSTNSSVSALRVVRFDTNGIIDPTFAFPGAGSNINAIAAQSDGKLILGGMDTNTISAFGTNRLMRLLTSGAVDPTFNFGGVGPVRTNVYAVAVESGTDKIYIGGDFLTYNGANRRKFTRLASDGTPDAAFPAGGFSPGDEVYSILPLPGGNVLVGGLFTNYNGTDVTNLVMLDNAGAVVDAFNTNVLVNGAVRAITLATNAGTHVLIGGDFTSVNTSNANRIARLRLSDGAIDSSMDTDGDFGGANATVRAIVQDAVNRFYVGGDFTSWATNSPAQRFVRINANGRLQRVMNSTNDPTGVVRAIALAADGKPYIGGDFQANVFYYPNNYSFDIYRSHTYTIEDDDAAAVSVTAPASPDGSFLITRVGSTASAVAVNFNVTGTATRGSDFQLRTNGILLAQNTVTIPAGASTMLVAVQTIDDAAEEFEETVVLSLTSVPSGQIGAPQSATIYLADNDGSIQFEQANFAANEGDGVVPITIRRTGNTSGTVTVDYVISNGSAVNGADFFGTNGTVTFFPGQLTTNFTITLTNDTLVEGNETVNFALANAQGGLPLGGQSTATLNIIDDDTAFQFSATNFLVTEIGGNGTVTIYRLGLSNVSHSVEFRATSGSATSGVDFTGVTNPAVTFVAGVTNLSVLVPILDDSILETNETVTLTLLNPTGSSQLGISNTVATLTILEDDSALVFASATYTTNEYGGSVVVTVNRVGGTVNTVTVNVNTLNGTAVVGADYFTNFTALSFTGDVIVPSTNDTGVVVQTPGQTTQTVTINLIDDVIGENDETVTVLLSIPAGGPAGATTLTTNSTTTITILDNEQPGDTDYEYGVAGSGFGANGRVLALGRQSTGRIIVGGEFTTMDGTTYNRLARLQTNGLVDTGFIIGTGANSNITAISVLSDDKIYIGGAFTNYNGSNRAGIARLNANGSVDTAFAPGTGANALVRSVAGLTNGQVLIGGDFTDYNGTNVNRLARINADGGFDTNFTADVSGPVHSMVVDASGRVVIGGLFTTVNGTAVTNVARLLTNGMLDLSFTAVGLDNTVAALTLQGDGKIVIGGSFTNVGTSSRNFLARLLTNGVLDTAFAPGTGPNGVIHSVATDANGKVIIGGDFTNYNGTIRSNFARIKGNGQVDPFFRPGQGANAGVRVVLAQADTALVIGGDFTSVNGITRNRVARVHGDEVSNIATMEFTSATYTVDENVGNATISLARYGATNFVTSVTVFTSDGSATHPADYTGITNVVTFALGERSNSTTVPIVDALFIPNAPRTINLFLTNAASGFLDTVTNALLTVNDNDVVFAFVTNAFSVLESVGTVDLGILRFGSLQHSVAARFSTQDGTASNLFDFIGQFNVEVPFGVGVTSNFVTITVLDDTGPELNEAANLLLTGSLTNLGTLQVTSTNAPAALAIRDDDNNPGLFAFSLANYTAVEGTGAFTITVLRTGGFVATNGADTTVGITVSSSAGTATNLVNYVDINNVISFTNLQTSGTTTLLVLDDAFTNGSRTVNLTLSVTDPMSGAVLTVPSTSVLTITDDDNGPGTFNFSTNAFFVSESLTNVLVTISRSAGSLGAIGLQVSTTNLTATHTNDYMGITNNLIMADAQITTNVSIPLIQDEVVEGNETFRVLLTVTSGGGILGSTSNAVVTIEDDDALVRFRIPSRTVTELVNTVTVDLDRLGATNGTATVQLQADPSSTATAGSDYTAFGVVTITFPPGVTQTNFTVTIRDDFTPELLPEVLTLAITNALPALSSNAFGVTVTNSGAFAEQNLFALSITDNDPVSGTFTVNYAPGQPFAVEEGTATVTFRIVRNGGAADPVTVQWRTTDDIGSGFKPAFSLLAVGSDYASPGVDFVAAAGSASWADTIGGVPNAIDISVTLLDDAADPNPEFNKDLFVVLHTPVNTASPPGPTPNVAPTTNVVGTGIGGGQIRLTIVDDDQPGGALDRLWNLDNNFGTTPTFNILPGANNTVQAVAIQSDDKAVIGGEFTAFNAQSANRIARVNTDGSFDATFNPNLGANGFVATVAIHTNAAQAGRIVVGGGFTSMDGTSRNGIARLLTNGTLDASFNPGAGFNGPVRSVAIQSDGKIVVGGAFTSFNGTGRTNLARLNSDGTLDTVFDPVNGANGTIYAVALSTVSSDIYIGGDFTTYNGVGRSRVARVGPTGLLDAAFDPGTGADGVVFTLAVETGGSVLLGGSFTSLNQTSRRSVARLLTTGAVDTTFNPGTGANNFVSSIVLQTDGKAVMAGSFTSYNGSLRKNLLRLELDGTLDTTFMDQAYNSSAGPTNADSFISAVALQSDGNAMIGGSFSGLGAPYSRINSGSPSQSATGSVPSTTNVTQLALMRWTQTKPRGNLARILGRPNPGPGNVHFENAAYTVNESAGLASIRLTRINGFIGPVAVDFSTADITAIAGADYQSQTGAVRWTSIWTNGSSGELRVGQVGPLSPVNNSTIRLTLINDALIEANETLAFSLGAVSGSFVLGSNVLVTPAPALAFNNNVTLTIVDDEFTPGVLGFSSAAYNAVENASVASIMIIRTNGSMGVVTVDFTTSTSGSTATAGADYTAVNGTLTFQAGETNKSFNISLLNDVLVETDETLSLLLTNVTGGATLGLTNATLTVTDDDYAAGRLTFSAAAYSVVEGTGDIVVTVQRNGGSVGAASALFYTTNGTATNGVHYTGTTNALTWANGDVTPRIITLPVANNFAVDGTRDLGLILTNLVGALAGSITNGTATILDDDAFGTVAFSSAGYSVAENGGQITVTVVRTGGNGGTVTLDLFTDIASGTASATTDYTPVNSLLTMLPGVVSASIAIPVLDNGIAAQPNKTVVLRLLNLSAGATFGSVSNATITIIDDESFNVPAGSVDTTFTTLVAANGFVQTVVLQPDGRLVVGGDFTLFNNVARRRLARVHTDGSLDTSFLLTGAGANAAVLTLSLQPDGRFIVGGSFTNLNSTNRSRIARLNSDGAIDSSFNPGAGADNPVLASAVYTAGADSGKILIGGSFATFNGTPRNFLARLNSDGSLDTSFAIGTGANGNVQAITIQSDGKVLVGGDFTAFNGASRTAGLTRLNSDGSVDTSFNLTGPGANGSVRVIRIQSDGKLLIGGLFTAVNGTANNFYARLSRDGDVDTAFALAGAGGADNAVYAIELAGDGKLVLAGDFTLCNGVTRNRITRLNADGTVDPTINFGTGANGFIGALALPFAGSGIQQIIAAGGFTSFNGTTANYLTRLNGGSLAGAGRLEFFAATYSGQESAVTLPIRVIRQGGTTGNASALLVSVGGTATNGVQYNLAPTTLTFPPGEVLKTVNVTVTNDLVVNADRTVNLVLSTFVAAAPGNQTNATLTLINDDTQIGFSTATYSVNENVVGGFLQISVIRTGSTLGSSSGDFLTSAGPTNSATAGVDYTAVNTVLTFGSGESLKVVNLPILDDAAVEGNETVTLTLTNLTGAAGITTAVLTIVENDFAPGELSFSTNSFTVNEAGGSAPITVLRSNGYTGVISVNYAVVAGGTAVAGVDYTPTSGTLAFADGQTSRTFTVPILPNVGTTNNLTVNLQLSLPTDGSAGGAVLNQNSAILTILNNDVIFGNFNFTNSAYSAYETNTATQVGGTFVTPIAVSRDGGNTGIATVAVLLLNGSATNGIHFNGQTSNTLSWAAGEGGVKTFFVTNVNNGVINDTRTVTLLLTNATGGASIGVTNPITYSILDDEVAPGEFLFAQPSFTVLENATNATVVIVRTNGFTATAGPVSVTFATADNTATNGIHYTGVTNIVSFTNTQTSATVLVPILDNVIVDGNKVVNLLLLNPAGGATVLVPSVTLTIVENDPVAGSVDNSFNPGTGPNAAVNTVATNGTGELLIGGDFTTYNNQAQNKVARLQASGALDTSFVVPVFDSGLGGSVYSLAVQNDGKVVIGGLFSNIGGTPQANLARLNTNGTLDAVLGTVGADSTVYAVAVQSNQRIVVGGDFTSINGSSRNFIARLLADGTVDTSFDPGFGANGGVRAVVVDGSGNVLVGGEFTSFNGAAQRRLVRLTANGAVDGTFNPGTNLNSTVSAIALQSDGKILVGGLFTQYGVTPRAYVARLNSDGSLDATFNPGAGLNGFVSDVTLMVDGRVVVGGGFTAFNGISRNRLAILTSGGALDPSSNLGTGANSFVAGLLVQGDGRIVLGGGFTTFNNATANYLTRINTGANLGSGTLGFSAANYDVAENAGSVTVSVVRSAGSSNAVAVAYALSPGTAISGTHYVSGSGVLTFAEGETLQTFTVSIIDDIPMATNAPRTINLSLSAITSGPVNTAPALLGASVATISILDRDAEFNFAVADFVAGELAGTKTVIVTRTGSSNGTVQVNFATVAGGTATAGADYTSTSGTLVFGDGVTSQTFNVTILDDLLVEGYETAALALSSPVGFGVGAVLGPVANATLTIVDNELSPGQIAFSTANYAVSEGVASRDVTVVRTNGTQGSVSVNYATANNTATSGADYVATSGSLIWASGDSAAKTFTVTILPDIAVEGNETVNLILNGANGGALITGGAATLTIQDDDDLVQFTTTAVTVFESVTNAVIAVQRVGAGNATVTVNYNTVLGGTASYLATNGTLTFNPGVTSQNIFVAITNDTLTNVTRSFSVQLSGPGGATLPGAGSLATVTVLDDDSVLAFATNAVSVSESLGSVSLTVTRAGVLNSGVTLLYTTTTNGTATNTTDYLPTNGVLVLGTNVSSATITVQILNDTIVEPDETFTVVLSAPTGEASIGAFATNTVTILNDDNLVQFAVGTYSVVERLGSITLNVVRTGASNGVVTVPFTSASVTAFAGTDFVATNGTLTFETNIVSTNLVVTILNDKLVESSESFTVTLGVPTGESTLGPTNSATVTIVDDESTLDFVATSVSALESASVLAVQATRVGALDSAVTLPFTFVNGSATNGTDFLGTNAGVTFGIGVNQQTFNVGISNDLILEPTKSFSILLGTPGGEAVLGTRTVMNVTIMDDDSVLQFPAGTLNVSESAQNATITVQRTGATNVVVSANLSTADGLAATATAGVDYGAVTTNLIFAIGENQKSFSVPLTNDSAAEGTEAFRVLLNSVTGEATIGAISTLTVLITDDDFRTLIAAGYALVVEGYQPTNNAVDPLETVTVNFSIQNIGNVTSPDITATLLLSGGVLSPGPAQVYTNLTNSALRTMPFTFTAAQVQTVTATLQLQDINGPAGAVTFPIDLGVPNSFSNRTLINIPGTITVPSFGPASPYTNQITVTNVAGLVNKVTVRLNGFSHTWPADVDILLVGPTGQKVLLMSDAGSGNSVANLNLTFDDTASSTLPELTTILDGTFRPTDYAPGDTFPAPAPAGPFATNLSAFNGTSPNGVWTLYIVDDTDQNIGSILTGWSLNLSTVSPLINLVATMTNSAATVVSPGQVTFTTTITNHGPNTASGVNFINVLPAGFTFVATTNSAGSNLTVFGSSVSGNLGTLATGTVHTVTVTAAVGVAGLFTNTAVVTTAGQVELVSGDNTASSVVAVTTGVLSLTGRSLGGGNVSLTVSNSVTGRTYVFEGTTNFLTPTASTVWTPVVTNIAVGSTLSVTNADVGGFLRRFYRAIER